MIPTLESDLGVVRLKLVSGTSPLSLRLSREYRGGACCRSTAAILDRLRGCSLYIGLEISRVRGLRVRSSGVRANDTTTPTESDGHAPCPRRRGVQPEAEPRSGSRRRQLTLSTLGSVSVSCDSPAPLASLGLGRRGRASPSADGSPSGPRSLKLGHLLISLFGPRPSVFQTLTTQ